MSGLDAVVKPRVSRSPAHVDDELWAQFCPAAVGIGLAQAAAARTTEPTSASRSRD